MNTITLHYGKTNNYLIPIDGGYLLFDAGLKGSYNNLKQAISDSGINIDEIKYVLISHYHADHCGTLAEILDEGVTLLYAPCQEKYGKVKQYTSWQKIKLIADGATDLKALGIDGELVYTPGHTNDSISLVIGKCAFAGDLIRLSEKNKGNGKAKKSWDSLLRFDITMAYYGHGEPENIIECRTKINHDAEYELVGYMIKLIDKGASVDKIVNKTGADREFVENVNRMYLTHRGVGVQGILDRIEIKGK